MLTGFSFNSLMPDYTISMIASETVGYVISAIAGVVFILAIFGVLVLFKKTIARKGS